MNEARAQISDQSEAAFYQSSLSIRPASTYKSLSRLLLAFLNIHTSHHKSSVYHSNIYNNKQRPIHTPSILFKIIMTVPTTCCGRSGQACVCAQQAKCSCGKQSALKCNCEKAKTENTVTGARCSCRKSFSPTAPGTLPARSSLRGISLAANLLHLLVVRFEVLVKDTDTRCV